MPGHAKRRSRVSGNIAFVDIVSGSVRGYTDTGRDTRDVAIALTTNGTSNGCPMVRNASSVSPDGRTAYVFTIRDEDQLYASPPSSYNHSAA